MSTPPSQSLLRPPSLLYTQSTLSSQVLPTPRANIDGLFAESPPDQFTMSPHGVDKELEIAALEHGSSENAKARVEEINQPCESCDKPESSQVYSMNTAAHRRTQHRNYANTKVLSSRKPYWSTRTTTLVINHKNWALNI
ncbi:hypothetical protein M8J77_017401 [Diaphorina citri]|nr:hypothetical protein M8J77_017401 [Diaphorina citri]